MTNATLFSNMNASNSALNHAAPKVTENRHRLAVEQALDAVQKIVPPVWPLGDYVAVNPYNGLASRTFLNARTQLQHFSDCEMLMPVAYYQERFQNGEFDRADLQAAIDELRKDDIAGCDSVTLDQLLNLLKGHADEAAESHQAAGQVKSLAAQCDQSQGSAWTENIREEIGKHFGAHFDFGQSWWSSPWKGLPIFQAWQRALRHDRRLELLGLKGLRTLVACLPSDPKAAVGQLLARSGVPEPLWTEYVLSLAFETPGWAAWAQYQVSWAKEGKGDKSSLLALVAMRLAYDVALYEALDFKVNWSAVLAARQSPHSHAPSSTAAARYAVLRANEIGYRNRLLGKVVASQKDSAAKRSGRKLAQMVFCIDVRSERIRRQLEAQTDNVDTMGFAGFFGLPIEYQRLGEDSATGQLPVLVPAQITVHENLRTHKPHAEEQSVERRHMVRRMRLAWKKFQSSAVSTFAFVETTGLFFGVKLLSRVFRKGCCTHTSRYDGVPAQDRDRLGPDLDALGKQGLSLEQQTDLAATILKNLGLVEGHARLVVFCGHGSQTENNPLQAGLDCGACGGHAGEPNARLAAMLLNSPRVRFALSSRGINVPRDTHFLAALHNTTTDAIDYLDLDLVPLTHSDDVKQLAGFTDAAGEQTRLERLPTLHSDRVGDPIRRSRDWSEVRPEWGLTGNAAFIVAPRSLTSALNLDGRCFMHSYDHNLDPEKKVLETIMTAPMVVANWINMQYYASTVDPQHFGSGTKTVHNVVGRFGVFSGSAGDLMTGLPWESVHDGTRYQHDPVRLLGIIAAPREAIAHIVSQHELLSNLVSNEWLHIVAYDDGGFHRLTAQQSWEPLELEIPAAAAN